MYQFLPCKIWFFPLLKSYQSPQKAQCSKIHVHPLTNTILFDEFFELNYGFDSQGEGSLDFEKEEGLKDKDIANQKLDWMAKGPLTLSCNLHKIPKYLEKLLSKFDPYKKIKVEDHIDDFYMHLRMLQVRYVVVSCNIFPFTLEGRVETWYHSLPINFLHSWREFKKLFLDKFVDENTPTMLLKEIGNSKIGERESEIF